KTRARGSPRPSSASTMAGAEIAVGLYERWAARRLGVCELPEEQSDDRGPH
ncbi:hypothetical protein K3Z85_13780, partial [Pseudomonas aeruginosa]|nr:hypothetical protein [Pseudomonas aeruginosa]